MSINSGKAIINACEKLGYNVQGFDGFDELILDQKFDLGLEIVERQVGMAAIRKGLNPMPAEVWEEVQTSPVTVLGPVSTMEYPPEVRELPSPSLVIRDGLDLFANIRPSKTRNGVPSVAKKMDLVIVRENTEGFYAARTMHEGKGEFMPTPDLAMSLRKITSILSITTS